MRSIDQLDAWISAKVRTWSSKISGTPRSTDLIEIRREILNDIRDHIEPKGGGKLVFPYNTIAITITAENDQRREMLEGAFGEGTDLHETISDLLREAGCAPAPGLQVTVLVESAQAPEGTEHAFHIDYSNKKKTAKEQLSDSRPNARLTVLRGEADVAEYAIHADRTNLGRLKEVVGDREGLRRRNDVAFSENETTVSREHAFIRYDAETGRFRVYDSMSQRGTSVFRDGKRFVVPKGPTRGFQLRSGDEIHLGDARLRFEIESV